MTQNHMHLHGMIVLAGLCAVLFIAAPVQAFTANSLDITIDKSGDATAVFRFTLEGLVENAIPQSMLEEQLVKGLGSGSEPPTLVSMDRSSATLLLKNFANRYDTAQGTDYQTSSMDFTKAQIALQNSAVSSVITADFAPSAMKLTFPDGYVRSFAKSSSLPSVTHTVIDPSKANASAKATKAAGGALNVTSTPEGTEVFVDGIDVGSAPSVFTGIAPGNHTLLFQKTGYTSVTRDIFINNGQTIRISVYLAEAAPTTEKSALPLSGIIAAVAMACCIMAVTRRQQ